jgi:hypothetical protein
MDVISDMSQASLHDAAGRPSVTILKKVEFYVIFADLGQTRT